VKLKICAAREKSRHDQRRRDESSREAGGHDDGRLKMLVDGGPGDRLSLAFSHSATQRPNFGWFLKQFSPDPTVWIA
jgi:hypothetical protein